MTLNCNSSSLQCKRWGYTVAQDAIVPAGVVGKAAESGKGIAGDETREEGGEPVIEESDEPVAESSEA